MSRRISRNSLRGLAAALLIMAPFALLFLVVSQQLPLDLDEAYYVLGGKLLTSGQLPYRDFFFPQSPLTAMLFGLWSTVFGDGFVVARYLGALLTIAIGLVIAAVVYRRAGVWHALVASAYYGLSIQVIYWMPRMKTYGTSSLLTVVALVLTSSAVITKKKVFVAGALAALAVSTRLLFAPVPVLVLLGILLRTDVPPSCRRLYLASATLGIAVGLAPLYVLALIAPNAFYFNNVGYHALRDGGDGLVTDFGQKFRMVKSLIGIRMPAEHGSREAVQFLLLLPASIATLVTCSKRERHLLVFPLAVVLLFVVSLLPTPTYRQYLVTLFPPAIIAVSLLAVRRSKGLLTVHAALLIPYAFASYRMTQPLLAEPSPKRPAGYDAVGNAVKELTQPHELVASLRAHFLFAADRPIEPCSYNCFGRRKAWTLPPEQIKEYHLCTHDDMRRTIRSGSVKAFVAHPNEDLEMSAELAKSGWTPIEQPLATIWIAPHGGEQ